GDDVVGDPRVADLRVQVHTAALGEQRAGRADRRGHLAVDAADLGDVVREVGLVAAGDPEPVHDRRVEEVELAGPAQHGDHRAVGYLRRSRVRDRVDQV